MKCLKNDELMQYADKEFSSKKLVQITEHIEACPGCRKNLQLMKEQIHLVKEEASLLFPETTFNKEFTYPSETARIKSSTNSILFWLRNSIRIPAPLIATLLFGIFILTGFLLIQNRKILKLESSLAFQKEQAQMYRVVNNEIKTMILKTNLSRFKPMDNPQIYIVKEKENDI